VEWRLTNAFTHLLRPERRSRAVSENRGGQNRHHNFAHRHRPPERHVPPGQYDNSPAFQRRVSGDVAKSPAGTAETKRHFHPSLRDLIFSQLIPALKCRAILVCSFGTKNRIQLSDKSSGICERSLFFQPPLLFKIFCQSWSGGVSKTSSSDAGNVSHALRFISSSSWPGDQPE
jgi:hypothetical protein